MTALWIQHFAFANAAVIYGVVVYIAKPELTRPDLSSTVFYSLIIASLMLIFLATRLPEMFVRPPSGAESAPDYLGRRQSQMVIMDALLEAGGILGVVASFVGTIDFTQLCVLLGISFLALIGVIPRISGWIEEYRTLLARERAGTSS